MQNGHHEFPIEDIIEASFELQTDKDLDYRVLLYTTAERSGEIDIAIIDGGVHVGVAGLCAEDLRELSRFLKDFAANADKFATG